MSEPTEDPPRDYLFINYATEDLAVAEWLALKLTSEGYKVWIDRYKLLGGESYPKDVEKALRSQTFRFLSLLSKNSLHKDNPLKERTLALKLQAQREEEFVIPLKVDGMSPAELDWMTTDLTFIPFFPSWAHGLAQLLAKLEKVSAPRANGDGRALAASVFLADDVLTDEPEPLYANLLRFEEIPDVVQCYRSPRVLSEAEREELLTTWAFWALPDPTGSRFYFSFEPPPRQGPAAGDGRWERVEAASWKDVHRLWQEQKPHNVLKPLLRRAILHHLRRKGLMPTLKPRNAGRSRLSRDRRRRGPRPQGNPTVYYFPSGLLPGDRVKFMAPDGSSKHRQVVGERAFPGGDRFRYHQAVTFDVLRWPGAEFVAKFRIRLHITDLEGKPLTARSAVGRRKLVTRDWWNDEWLYRHLVVTAFMAEGSDRITIGGPNPVVLSARLPLLEAPRGYDEEALPKGTSRYTQLRRNAEEETPEQARPRGED